MRLAPIVEIPPERGGGGRGGVYGGEVRKADSLSDAHWLTC
jgi:hypothetical protein